MTDTSTLPNRVRPPTNGAYYAASVLYNAGFRGWPLTVMTAIAGRESSWNAKALNNNASTGDYSVGLWQINYFGNLLDSRTQQFGSPQQLQSDPQAQANAAYQLAGGNSLSGLGNWALASSPAAGSTPPPTKSGYSILPYMAQAAAASAAVGSFGPAPSATTGNVNNWPNSGSPSVMAGGYGTNATLTSAPLSSSTDCNTKGSIGIPGISSIPLIGNAASLNYCHIKALLGGVGIAVGGTVAIIGVALIVAAGLGRSGGPIGQVAAGVVGYRSGRRTQANAETASQARASREIDAAGNPNRRGSASSRDARAPRTSYLKDEDSPAETVDLGNGEFF